MARKASPEMMAALIACVRSSEANWNEKIRAADIVLTRAWGLQGKTDLDLTSERVTSIEIVIERNMHAAASAGPEQPQQLITLDTVPVGNGDA